MCSLHSNAIADEGFAEMGKKDRENFEKRLARLADEDSIEVPNGLWSIMDSVRCWAMHNELRAVRKYRMGRHRFYITGRHTDCNYTIRMILPFKRDEDDRAKDADYKAQVLAALRKPAVRLIPPPTDTV